MNNDEQSQLVQLVARQVIAVLRSRGKPPHAPAAIAPPVGTCTGDYSKFTELSKRLVAADAQAVRPLPLSGIITGNQLQEAMNASADGVALIAADARLTPLANDLMRQDTKRVQRVSPSAAAAGPVTGASTWLWWIDGQCSTVDEVTGQRSMQMRSSSLRRDPSSLGRVVREIAATIKSGHIRGALLFVHNAARVMCFANRCTTIRAVVGTCGEAVEQGINELGANVLVIEYLHVGPRVMAAMVDRMLQQPPNVPAQVQRELADLHRC